MVNLDQSSMEGIALKLDDDRAIWFCSLAKNDENPYSGHVDWWTGTVILDYDDAWRKLRSDCACSIPTDTEAVLAIVKDQRTAGLFVVLCWLKTSQDGVHNTKTR